VIDGLGGEDDFETIDFDYQWVDLTSVSVQTVAGIGEGEWALDHVVIAYVPEPSMGLLQIVTFSCLIALRSRKRS
jgi:hypothetical protein